MTDKTPDWTALMGGPEQQAAMEARLQAAEDDTLDEMEEVVMLLMPTTISQSQYIIEAYEAVKSHDCEEGAEIMTLVTEQLISGLRQLVEANQPEHGGFEQTLDDA